MSKKKGNKKMEKEDKIAGFVGNIFNIRAISVEELEENWTAFKNDIMTLCLYHHDYSIEEMIGIVKFLLPIVTFDDNFGLLNKKYNISCGKQLREVLDYLEIKNLEEKLAFASGESKVHFLEKEIERRNEYKNKKEN
jgi:hypothetical protein